MFEQVRDILFRAMTTKTGDSLAPIRIPKDLARRLNATLGHPIAPLDELGNRSKARKRLAELRSEHVGAGIPVAASKEAAPILVYYEKDRNVRELTRIEELLGAKGYAWKRLDVAGDEATLDFVMREADCERDDLPVVFVANRVIGRLDALVRTEVSGEFAKAVHGE